MKRKKYLKITVATLLAVALMLTVGGIGEYEAANKKTIKLKGWANISGALLEWKKVDGATSYNIYRAQKIKNKKGKETKKYTKYEKITTVKETYFYCNGKDNSSHKRWYVDMFSGKKGRYTKHSCRYLVKSDNGYKSNTFSFKKGKFKKGAYVLGYPELYYVNNARRKAKPKLPVLMWEHSAEKGIKQRTREIKKDGYYGHTRPNNKSCFTIWKEDKYKIRGSIYAAAENVGPNSPFNKKYAGFAVTGFLESPGHKANVLGDYGNDGTFVAGACTTHAEAGNVDAFFKKKTSNKKKKEEAIQKMKEENKTTKVSSSSTTVSVENIEALAGKVFAGLMIGMIDANFSTTPTDEDVKVLFDSYKQSGQLTEAISKLGETKTYEFFKEYITENLFDESKVDERRDWLYRIGKLLS